MHEIHQQADEVKKWLLNELYDAREKGIKEGFQAVYDFIESNPKESAYSIAQEIKIVLSSNPYQSRLRRRRDPRP